jgi:hypothetical protein
MENQSQVLISRTASLTWSHFHTPEATPIWFILKRSIAMSLSSLLRNLAVIGESGMKILETISGFESVIPKATYNITTEKATVKLPQKRKMICITQVKSRPTLWIEQ